MVGVGVMVDVGVIVGIGVSVFVGVGLAAVAVAATEVAAISSSERPQAANVNKMTNITRTLRYLTCNWLFIVHPFLAKKTLPPVESCQGPEISAEPKLIDRR
jgi:hypothetical protein